jgi:hypothetical protein
VAGLTEVVEAGWVAVAPEAEAVGDIAAEEADVNKENRTD